jgi:hypothetical protein
LDLPLFLGDTRACPSLNVRLALRGSILEEPPLDLYSRHIAVDDLLDLDSAPGVTILDVGNETIPAFT